MHEITVRHTFEAAHRLPHLPGKCTSLHGHSWRVAVTVAAPSLDAAGMVVEFGAFKALLRAWIDERLDHGVMLGGDDPLAAVLAEHGKVFSSAGWWPTVESVARLIGEVAHELLGSVPHVADAQVIRVDVAETETNGASWVA
ncbi:6-carboxytetrahydropterin synthase [Spongiactinospora sp. TRM90649]|uniref:6-pyruvoyl trahydropterin synthase family protein n=1 Tax=Spongiactinospora sp. TRM90649 TaxID=3031114 RepID=UPI0023F7E91B|nr:6-carboxytetrahydropterin synthase [Spongiactinospora sp. TRM90649]MDF5756637.1 6-carboxytetrahydropterin synthase [Spongiactinospora sp. TRM90649]